jgi:hypothetical protein
VASILIGAVGVAALGVLAYTTAHQAEGQIVSEFSAGQAQLEAGKALLQSATKDRSQPELDRARTDFLSAQAHFNRAPDILSKNPFLGAASFVGIPYIAPRLQAARSLSLMGTSLAHAALIGVDIDSLLVHPSSGSTSSGPFAVLNQMTPKVPTIKHDLVVALQAAQSVDPGILPSSQAGTLKQAIDSIQRALSSVNQLAALLPVATEILGGNGPRTYLIEQSSNPELRAGGGFIGSVSLITANLGQLKLGLSGGIENWEYPRPKKGQPGYVAPPGPLQDFISNSWGLADSNFFPSFKTSAHWAEVFAQTELKVKPDGVISIDPDFVAGLLNVTGPLKVPGYNVTVTSSTFTNWLFQQQFLLKNVTSSKKAVFGLIATDLISRLTSLPPSRWPDLMTQLNAMTTARHLQVYFDNGPAEAIMDQYGWSGTMNPRGTSDYMYEVESNFGATKANHFLVRSYRVDLSIVNGKLHHVVQVTDKNAEPWGYEGGNVYDCYVRLYVPGTATRMVDATLIHKKFGDNTVPAGYQELDGWLYLPVNPDLGYSVRTMVFQYDTPWSPTGGTQTIYWQKQPGTESDRISITWKSGGHTYSTSGVLDSDQMIQLAAGSVTLAPGQAGTATVPSLSL